MKLLRALPRVSVALLIALLALEPATAGRRQREPLGALEPVESRRETVLAGRSGVALVATGGERTRVPLRRSERLVEIAELGRGWAAAGLRPAAGGVDLIVLQEAGAGLDRLPSPARGGGLHRVAPRLLVERDELAGVAWLEGARPDRLAVRAAGWTGGGWEVDPVVAAPGPGSQTGLAQAVLADGSWLLVWSRWDGRENELYWSRRTGGGWSAAVPVEAGDGVPDVTPTLVRDGSGALLAWSEYDGRDYRLRLARFDHGGWRRLPVDAGRGVLQPRFRRRPEGTWILARSAVPRGWLALEIGGARPGRVARVETASSERPLLRPAGGGMVFEWAGVPPASGRWETPR